MPANSLQSEVSFIPGVPDGVSTIACVVGDTVSCAVQAGLFSQTTTLTRKPSGSSASISSNALSPDVTGYYTVTVVVGSLGPRGITFVAFPTSVLAQKIRPNDPNSPSVNKSVLQNVVTDQRVTLASIAAALESGAATFTLSTLFGGAFVGWGSFG